MDPSGHVIVDNDLIECNVIICIFIETQNEVEEKETESSDDDETTLILIVPMYDIFD